MLEPYKPIYTVKEAAKVLKVNPSKVYELINTKKLPYLLLGQKKIRGSDLEYFIENYPSAQSGGDLNGEDVRGTLDLSVG